MNKFPIQIKRSPIPFTIPNLIECLNVKKNASWAAPQKLFPVTAI